MSNYVWPLAKVIFTLIVMVDFLAASEPPDGGSNYLRDIKPLLKARCYACHGGLKQESGLRLDTGESIRKGGDHGVVVAPGTVGGRLLERIGSQDLSVRMPPEGAALSGEEISRITKWIEQGAISPENELPQPDPRRHWAFQRPVRARATASDSQFTNPIDVFLARERTRHGIVPLPPAPKSVQLRRVSLDLIGLPPTRDDMQAFLADESPGAYERIVDRLLNSAQYGERWGRHWMDVWRYSDWYGRRHVPDVWNSAPQIWRWRDWIVNSLNSDKGYDQMVSEMLAADEIVPENEEAGHATGFLIRNWYALNPNDWMRSNVEHTGKAFLGLTFNCAHCHDHKYDPISQDDYFRLRAFFEPISIRQDRVAGEADPGPFQEYSYSVLRKIVRLGEVRIFDKTPDAPTWFYTGGDERNRVPSRGSIPPGIPAFLASSPIEVQPVTLPPRAWYPAMRPAIQASILADLQSAIQKTDAELTTARSAADAATPDLQAKLNFADAEFAQGRSVAVQAGQPLALAGTQSLLLDATTGRRVLYQGMQSVKTLPDQSTISFQIQILKDAHVNFQLSKDVAKGLTATCVIFEKGQIRSYRPNSFDEFDVGRYDIASGQNRFEVTIVLQNKEDRCLLTVKCVADGRILADQVPIARNGWNPVGDSSKGIWFDARPGSVAAVDDLILTSPLSGSGISGEPPPEGATSEIVCFNFEPPRYKAGSDISGVEGWIRSPYSLAPATSLISATIGSESLAVLARNVNSARRALDVHLLKVKSFEAKRVSLDAELAATHARIAADKAQFEDVHHATAESLSRTAGQLSLQAKVLAAEAEVLVNDQILAASESTPMDDAKCTQEIDAASQKLAAAHEALQTARRALADPAQAATYASLGPQYPRTSTGRRKALAHWIASRENPLTARVAVNHIWLRHFHSALVSTVYDFGINGAPPTHPALLDWLAVELMQSNWSMKHIHRLIVTSDAYRMSSASVLSGQPAHAIDPENRFYWRRNPGRMEAEVVRDCLLSNACQLDLRLGGQEVENSQALTTFRRSLYYSCHPEVDGKSSFGALFDAPEPGDCYRRTVSIVPQQSLALTNSDLIHDVSSKVAETLWQSLTLEQKAGPNDFIVAAFEQLLTRRPTDTEIQACCEFLGSYGPSDSDQARGRDGLVRAIFNHNDFIAIR